MNFNYKNPISPLTSLGTISLPRTEVYGTNFSVLSTGGYMEVYSINDLYYTIPSGSTGLIEYTGNTIPIQFQKGTGSIFSPDVLTLNSDNISSGRRRLGMLVYVIEQDQIYQYQIPNFINLWTGVTSATGPGGPTLVMSDFGTTIKSNSPEGVAFISSWTANTIEGISGETSSTAVWKKLVTGGGSGGSSITGGTFDYNTGTLSLNSSASTITITGFTDVYVTGGTFSAGTITFTNNSGGTFVVSGVTSGEYLPLSGGSVTGDTIFTSGLTANTFSASTYLGLPQDVYVTGGTYSAGTATFTNNTGGTFNVFGFYTGGTDVYVTGGTFSKSAETLTLERNDNISIPITGFTDIFVTGGTYGNGVLNLTNNSGTTFSISGFSTSTGGTSNYYGSFSDTTTQVVSGSNIATVWTYNTTEISNGIYIEDGSKIKVSNDGIYEIGYLAQIEKTQGGTPTDVTIWASINGTPIDRTSSTITLVSNSAYQLPFVSYIFDLYAGDYVEFYFSAPSDYVQITTLSGLTSPTRPVSPSVIVVSKAIGNAVLNTSGDSFVTGFTLSGSDLLLNQNRVGSYSGFSVNLPFLPLSGGTITGDLSVSGSVSATTYYGNGSNLTGISRGGGGGAGGQLYYFNISNIQSPYYEFSTTATTATEQTISATAAANATVLIGGFMTPSTLPNITNFPAGILSFYLHTYGTGTNHSFNTYCELYKRTTGGTETLLFTSDPTAVVGNVVTMVISDGYFSGATLNTSDRLVVKVYGTNLTNQTRTIYLVSEGSPHYSFVLTTIPTFTDTYVTGFTYNNNTLTIKQNNNQSDLTTTINFFTGLTATTISAATYQNLPTDVFVTGGTFSSNTITFTNNTGGTFNVTGITATASSGIFGISNSSGTYTYYSTLSAAMTAAVSGSTIEMFADVTESGTTAITLKSGISINGNGRTYNFVPTTSNVFNFVDGGVAINFNFFNITLRRSGSQTGGGILGMTTSSSVINGFSCYMIVDTPSSFGITNSGGAVFAGSVSGFDIRSNVATSVGISLTRGTIINCRVITNSSTGSVSLILGTMSNSYVQCTGSGYGISAVNTSTVTNVTSLSNTGNAITGAIANSFANNCYFYSSGGITANNINIRNSTILSDGNRAVNTCTIFNCVVSSTSEYGAFVQNVTISNSVVTSSANSAVYLFDSANVYLSYIQTSSANPALYFRNNSLISKAKGCTIINTANSASGHGIRYDFVSAFTIDCQIQVANTGANCLFSASPIAVRFRGCGFEGSTTSVNANVTQAISNSEDNQGNITIN